MKEKLLYGSWIFLYLLCAIAGYWVTEPDRLQLTACMLLSGLFFVPPCLLLVDAYRRKDEKAFRLLRWISGLSLGLTLLMLVANVLSALGSEALGNVLYGILAFVSVPMLSSHQWFLSMLLWACLFFATLVKKRK